MPRENKMKYNKIGHYEPVKVEKGVNETSLPLKEGEIFWEVCIGKGAGYGCLTQTEAEIISRLVIIEQLLKKK